LKPIHVISPFSSQLSYIKAFQTLALGPTPEGAEDTWLHKFLESRTSSGLKHHKRLFEVRCGRWTRGDRYQNDPDERPSSTIPSQEAKTPKLVGKSFLMNRTAGNEFVA
jgi:hypothetical protein